MTRLLWPVGAAVLLFAGPVHAQIAPQAAVQPASQVSAQSAAPSTASSTSGPRPAVAINDDDLAHLDGRQGSPRTTVISDQDLSAINRGNSITAHTVGSGPITLGPRAFEGFAGVGNFVINSGHNNNLQGAMTINIVTP